MNRPMRVLTVLSVVQPDVLGHRPRRVRAVVPTGGSGELRVRARRFASGERRPRPGVRLSAGCPSTSGAARNAPMRLDHGNEDLIRLLRSRRWDAIECVCWANAATNRAVLDACRGDDPRLHPARPARMDGPDVCPASPSSPRRSTAAMIRRADSSSATRPGSVARSRRRARIGTMPDSCPLGCDFRLFAPAPCIVRNDSCSSATWPNLASGSIA